MYGTTVFCGPDNAGIIFRLDPSGKETVLHSFNGVDGANPYGGTLIDIDGNLYGMTFDGGTSKVGGVIYKLTIPK